METHQSSDGLRCPPSRLPQLELNTLSDHFASIVDDPGRPNVLLAEKTRGHQESGDDDHHFSKFAPVSVETVLRQDPLDLSFWSFLTLHHGIEDVERHLL